MNETKMTVPGRLDGTNEEINLIDLMVVLGKHKTLVIGLPLGAAVVAAGISLAMPNWYKSTAKLLPPRQAQSSTSALLSQLSGMAGVAAGAAGLKSPNELYVGMLKSRTVADKLIAKFDLKKVYETDSQEKAIAKLKENTSITSGKEGLIEIEVQDKDKKLVAPLTNAYVSELLQLTKVLAVTEAGQRRVFYERQLEQAKDNLAKAEMSLKGALDTRGVISVDTESRAVLETVGRLRAQVSAKEIQLNSMGAFLTPNNQEYKRVVQELGSLRGELVKLENGRGGEVAETAAGNESGKQNGFENIKLLRDVKYYQMLYELLAKQYEAARLDEASDPSVIQVLDPAVEPERNSKPSRALITLAGTFAGAVWALIWAFGKEAYSASRRNPASRNRWDKLAAAWKRKPV